MERLDDDGEETVRIPHLGELSQGACARAHRRGNPAQ